ncbi:hypothetical protein [Novacetimonas hansenii]|uniref:hypothetical protein n=1 Tax=Novacetimonas hansenii TaxID=436 RepID=UPI00094F4CBC|nr:hypothetical protein [Novacetimonas hansenii]PYD73367.1 hypothetical protein CFR74_04390 [Novacetimonas hansenii]
MAPVTNSSANGVSRAMEQVRQLAQAGRGAARRVAARRRAAMAAFRMARPSLLAMRAVARRAGARPPLHPHAMLPPVMGEGPAVDGRAGAAAPPSAMRGDHMRGDVMGDVTGNVAGGVTGGVTGRMTGRTVRDDVTGSATGPVIGPGTGHVVAPVAVPVTGEANSSPLPPSTLTPAQRQAIAGRAGVVVRAPPYPPPTPVQGQQGQADGNAGGLAPQDATVPVTAAETIAADAARPVVAAKNPPPSDRKLSGEAVRLRKVQTARMPAGMGYSRLAAMGVAAMGAAANIGQESGSGEWHRGDAGDVLGAGQWHAPRAQDIMQAFGIDVHGAKFADQVKAYGQKMPSGLDLYSRKAGRALMSGFHPPRQATAPIRRFDERPVSRDGTEDRNRGAWADIITRQMEMANIVPGATGGHKTEVHIGDIVVHANTHDGNRIATQIQHQLRQSLPALANTGQR